MSNWKPKNLEEALDDAIGSALNDFSGGLEAEYIDEKDFNDVVKEAIKNIKNIKGLMITYERQ